MTPLQHRIMAEFDVTRAHIDQLSAKVAELSEAIGGLIGEDGDVQQNGAGLKSLSSKLDALPSAFAEVLKDLIESKR